MCLSGCTGALWGAAALGGHELNLFQNPDVNLTAKNYAVADYLIQQGKTFIEHDDVIKLEPLVNVEDKQTPAEIGSLIPEHIGARLIQLGYNVDMSALGISEKIAPRIHKKPDIILSGHYLNNPPEFGTNANLDISLRLVHVKQNRSIGAFDYVMPSNREIRRLSTPKPQIIILRK